MARGGYNPEAEADAVKRRAESQAFVSAELEALGRASATRRAAQSQAFSGPPGASHVTQDPLMSEEEPDVLDAMAINEEEVQAEIAAQREEEAVGLDPNRMSLEGTLGEAQAGMSMEGGASMPPAPPPEVAPPSGDMSGGGGGTGEAEIVQPLYVDSSGRVDPTPENMRILNKVLKSYQAAAKTEFEADQEIEKQRTAFDRDRLDLQEELATKRAAEAESFRRMETLRQETMEAARAEIARANEMVMDATIDPKRLFPNTMSKMASALAVGLGQFGATLTGTQNAALQIIDSAIANDIAAQRADIENLKFGVQTKQNEYSMLMSEFQDRRTVEAMIYDIAYAQLDTKLAQVETKFGINSSDARVTKLRAAFQKQRADNKSKYQGIKMNAEFASYTFNSQLEAQRRAAAAKAGLDSFSPEIQKKVMGARQAKRMIAGLKELAKDTHALGYFNPAHGKSQQYQEQLKGLAAQIVRTYSGVTATEDEREQVQDRLGGYFNLAETKNRRLEQIDREMDTVLAATMDVMTERERAFYVERFGDPRLSAGSSMDFIKQMMSDVGIKARTDIAIVGPKE